MEKRAYIRAAAVLLSLLLLLTGCSQRQGGRTVSVKPQRTGTQVESAEDKKSGKTKTTGRAASGREMDAETLAEYLNTRVVKVCTDSGFGSGFFIDDEGTLVTNYHVIAGGSDLYIQTSDGAKYDVNTIVNFSQEYDLAVLKADISNTDYLPISYDCKQGATVYTYGTPRGLEFSMSEGMISSASRMLAKKDCIQITALINPGNSGGPCVNTRGEVLAVNTSKLNNSEGIAFSVKMSMLDEMGADKNYSLSRFQDWCNKEDARSYWTTSDGETFWATNVHTYTTVTGRECLAHGDTLDGKFSSGYAVASNWYIYEYDMAEYDEFCDYLYSIGFEYGDAGREIGLEVTQYVDNYNGYSIAMLIDTASNALYISRP